MKQILLKTIRATILITLSLCFGKSHTSIDLSNQWKSFILNLEQKIQQEKTNSKIISDCVRLKELLQKLKELEALTLWKGTEFYQAITNNENKVITTESSLTIAQELGTASTPELIDFLSDLLKYKKSINHINGLKTAEFKDKKSAEYALEELTNLIILPLTNKTYSNNFQKASFIGKSIACTVMLEAIDSTDTLIKTIKTSSLIPWNERIVLLKKGISSFFTLFNAWSNDIMPLKAISYHEDWPLEAYCSKISFFINYFTNEENPSFQKSNGFSVEAAVLGSKTAFERHYPKTFEDLFMLIHQNCLAIITGTYGSLFPSEALEKKVALPEIVIQTLQAIEKHNNQVGYKINRIGMNYREDGIEFLFNMPLRNHSSTLKLTYNNLHKTCLFTINFLGQARTRWEKIAFLGAISPELSGLQLSEKVLLDKKAGITSITWIMRNKNDLKIILDYCITMADLSFESDLSYTMMKDLFRGQAAIATVLEKALENYIKNYGINPNINIPNLTTNYHQSQKQYVNNFPAIIGIFLAGCLTVYLAGRLAESYFRK
jgi:hypothetical protein